MIRMHDVAVVGGGPVGVFAAALLASHGLDVVVWERRTAPPGHSRAIGIHPPSLHAFDELGLADRVVEGSVPIGRAEARGSGRTLGTLTFDRADRRFPFVAARPQSETEALLRERLHDLSPEALRLGVELVGLEQTAEHVLLRGVGPHGPVEAAARFVVAADGARSPVRRLVGISAPVAERGDHYVMADLRDDTGDGETAVVNVERAGVVESFPLPGGVRRFVAAVAEPAGVPSAGRADEAAAETVARLVRERTGATVDAATATMTSAFSVRTRLATSTVAGRVVLIGDAAHEISPIGGQGMNLGWLDAQALVPVLRRALRSAGGRRFDPGAFAGHQEARRRSARRAAGQARLNTALGRPCGAGASAVRQAGLRVALGLPSASLLAATYAMRFV